MEKNTLETQKGLFTIEDLRKKNAELEALEEKEANVSAEFIAEIENDGNEIGE